MIEARWAGSEARWERMRARIDDLASALRARDLLVHDLVQAMCAVDIADWRTSNAALKRVEEAARLLRMTDKALVELEAGGGTTRCVQGYLMPYLTKLHLRVVDAEHAESGQSARHGRGAGARPG